MKTSIFNMTLTLPPMIEMTQVKKDLSTSTAGDLTLLCCLPFA